MLINQKSVIMTNYNRQSENQLGKTAVENDTNQTKGK